MNRFAFLTGVGCAAVLWSTIYYWLGYTLCVQVEAALRVAAWRVVGNVSLTTEIVVVIALAAAAAVGMMIWRRRTR